MSSKQAFIAANRFGYGANIKTIQQIQNQPQKWLLAQITSYNAAKELDALNSQWSSQLATQQVHLYRQQRSLEKKSNVTTKENIMVVASEQTQKEIRKQIASAMNKTIYHLIVTDSPFYWRLVDFFSNHFSVTAKDTFMRALAPTLELEAIAPNITGSFADMLLAVESHPAMLVYLNNEKSTGPNSKLGQRSKGKRGLNENLAREILELHTLGVNAGYLQTDVTELARAITGWGVAVKGSSGFVFNANLHEPGSRDVFGKNYNQDGVKQGVEILEDLALNAKTAEFISRKLVIHFINDEPPQKLVNTMVDMWLKTKGDLPQVLAVMLKSPLSWSESNAKFKTPREFLISTCRACGIDSLKPNFTKSLTILGQRPFAAGSPAGYKDSQDYWAGPRAIMGRIEWAEHISKFVKKRPLNLAKQALGPTMEERTELLISRAESKQQAVTLFLMSPEFQKR